MMLVSYARGVQSGIVFGVNFARNVKPVVGFGLSPSTKFRMGALAVTKSSFGPVLGSGDSQARPVAVFAAAPSTISAGDPVPSHRGTKNESFDAML
jgi:hypothetical protein